MGESIPIFHTVSASTQGSSIPCWYLLIPTWEVACCVSLLSFLLKYLKDVGRKTGQQLERPVHLLVFSCWCPQYMSGPNNGARTGAIASSARDSSTGTELALVTCTR